MEQDSEQTKQVAVASVDHKSEVNCNCKKMSEMDDPDFGKEHDWKRVVLILVTYVFFVLTLGFNFIPTSATRK